MAATKNTRLFRTGIARSELDENWYHLQTMKSKYDTRL
ncbi:hypothetical protein HP15_2489 [Marinobacter adhaerens HP15]|uniref:Uncharacterized protein n=1 Tax=Marinobacter adhaerens (strain DSM 23420 / HP15) TaxID=225937 RepID=E4PHW5_MARAH|nr:hypothetical protein HP15_2489 [Marinobacter adhaerens HP15]